MTLAEKASEAGVEAIAAPAKGETAARGRGLLDGATKMGGNGEIRIVPQNTLGIVTVIEEGTLEGAQGRGKVLAGVMPRTNEVK